MLEEFSAEGDDWLLEMFAGFILKALADETEYVRDTALRAGQRIINLYAETAIELLLPEVENGLFHENWRIRQSSVQLLGDLMFRISGEYSDTSSFKFHFYWAVVS